MKFISKYEKIVCKNLNWLEFQIPAFRAFCKTAYRTYNIGAMRNSKYLITSCGIVQLCTIGNTKILRHWAPPQIIELFVALGVKSNTFEILRHYIITGKML